MKLLYLLTIGAARRSLDIESSYFITDESTRWSLAQARRRGVRVRLVVEGDITDAKPVTFAGRAAYERLLEQGIDIYEYQPAMMHAKAIVIDEVLSIVGSANFDNRSLELNVAVFDRTLATRLLAPSLGPYPTAWRRPDLNRRLRTHAGSGSRIGVRIRSSTCK